MSKAEQEKRVVDMYAMYQSGATLREVGNAFGVTNQSIGMMFKRRGLKTRTKEPLPFIVFNGRKYTKTNRYWQRTARNDQPRYLHQDVWEFHHGNIPEGCEIHHIDENKDNNAIENLECLSADQHHRKHKPAWEISDAPRCLNCGNPITRKVHPSGGMYAPSHVRARKYCSPECLAQYRTGKPRNLKDRTDYNMPEMES